MSLNDGLREVLSSFGTRMIMILMWQSSRSLTLSMVLVWHRMSSHKHDIQGCYDISIPGIGRIFLPLEEQQLWIPNQQVHDPDSWTDPHLLQLKMEYDVLINKYGCKVQEMYTVQDHPPPPSEHVFLSRWWNIGDPGKQTCKSWWYSKGGG